MLQNRINELNSGILNIKEGHVHITGFMSEKMLDSYLTKGARNWSSIGLYDEEEIEFHNIKDNAMFIVKKDGKEIGKYQYKPIHKRTIEFKKDGKKVSRTVAIRKSVYSDHYHLYFVLNSKEKDSDDNGKRSFLFESEDELNHFLKDKFDFQL